jgi:hypothetical protein
MSKRSPTLHDPEMAVMVKICQLLATLQPAARERVMSYVAARVGSLPVIAGVGGGIEQETEQPFMFPPRQSASEAAE